MSRLLLLVLFFILLFFFPSSFFHDPPLHPPSILLSSSSYNYPILIFLYFFCTYSFSTLFSPSPSLSFIPSLISILLLIFFISPKAFWPIFFFTSIHQNSLIFSMLLIHVSGLLCQIARPFYCIYMHTYMYLYTYITVFNTNFCFKTECVVSGMHYENALRNLNSIKCKMTNLRSLLTVVMVVCIRYGKPC